MKPAAAILYEQDTHPPRGALRDALESSPLIEPIITVKAGPKDSAGEYVTGARPLGGSCLARALEKARGASFVFIFTDPAGTEILPEEISSFLEAAGRDRGGLCYADFYSGERTPHSVRPVADWQPGSIRDDFDFGPVQLFSMAHIEKALSAGGPLTESSWGGLYELRLKVSAAGALMRIPSPLCRILPGTAAKDAHFAYVDPVQAGFQKEMERIATAHLKQIGAFCSHELKPAPEPSAAHPVEASIVIPVRNRERTIADALKSALEQQADFTYNVLVVQNHSTDGTRDVIDTVSRRDARVVQIIPARKDLGIGGCWNEAIGSAHCGRYVCQLDSDDLYADPGALAEMVGALHSGRHGMVVGSYRVVNDRLEEVPPGVVDHREWTAHNGRNNLLRVQGIGAPRAFPGGLLRQHPFPNVSYGEDYAVALRLTRDFTVGRIFRPLYLCRRWDDNTDANLTPLEANRLAFYKDRLRTEEIKERQRLNADNPGSKGSGL